MLLSVVMTEHAVAATTVKTSARLLWKGPEEVVVEVLIATSDKSEEKEHLGGTLGTIPYSTPIRHL